MRITALLSVLALAGLSAACTPTERAASGAVAGAVIADVTDGNALTGAVIGGLAGAASCTLPGQYCQ